MGSLFLAGRLNCKKGEPRWTWGRLEIFSGVFMMLLK